jgi:hypothetical protein
MRQVECSPDCARRKSHEEDKCESRSPMFRVRAHLGIMLKLGRYEDFGQEFKFVGHFRVTR